MITIAIEDDCVVVQLSGWDCALALRQTVRLPLAAVTVARAAPEMVARRPRGFRFPGASWPFRPGPVFAGSFVELNRHWSFWSVRRPRPDELLMIETDDNSAASRYRLLVLQVADPAGDARRILLAADRAQRLPDRQPL